MTQLNEVFKCEVCGNIVQILHTGEGELVCCGQPMNKMNESLEDEGKEKHVPVIHENPEGVEVVVGSEEHPMEDEHYIEWIEVLTKGGRSYRKYLQPGEEPKARFNCKELEIEKVREYCNVHGLWANKG